MRLELVGATAGYGSVVALRNVSLVVPSGRIVALLGANGAGKSTLLNVSSGLLPARSGSVLIDGQDVTHTAPQERAALGLCHVPEAASVYAGLTVADNLRMFLPRRSARDGIDRALDAFPILRKHLRQHAGSLSGGQQRQLALARAYASNPRLILADELSMGLAPNLVDEIIGTLARIATGGTTVLIVEQYASKALRIADLVYVLARGEVAFAGEPKEVNAAVLTTRYLSA